MLRSWVSSQYLGHANLKNSLDSIKRSIENVALTAPGLTVYDDTMTTAVGGGLGGFLRVVATFLYRIEDAIYMKGTGITQAINSGDKTCRLIPGNQNVSGADQTAAYGDEITTAYYKAGVLLIDASGNFSTVISSTEAGKVKGVSAGARAQALGYLLDELDTADIDDKAVVAFFVIGDGTNTFTSTSSLTIATNLDLYQLGGMALSSGQSTDGAQMLGLL